MNLLHLHPKLKAELNNGQKSIFTILDDRDNCIKRSSDLTVFERNNLIAQNAYQRALAAEYFGDIAAAYAAAERAYRHNSNNFYQHPDLVRIALAQDTEESRTLAFEIAEYFAGLVAGIPPFWADWDEDAQRAADVALPNNHYDPTDAAATAMDKLITAAAEKYPDMRVYFYRKNAVRLITQEEDYDAAQKMLDEWRASGIKPDYYDRDQSMLYYESGQNEALIAHWQGRDNELARQVYPTAYWMTWTARILAGQTLPDNLTPPTSNRADTLYTATTWVLNIHDDLDENPVIDKQLLRLGITIGEHTLKLYEAVEKGTLNGYANDAHVYAMLCRNLGCLHNHNGNTERCLDLAEVGFALSPFIENGYVTIAYAYELGQYERSLANIGKVRKALSQYIEPHERRNIGRHELRCLAKLDRPDDAATAYQKYHAREAKHLELVALYSTHAIESIDEYLPADFTEELESHNYFLSCVKEVADELLAKHPEHPALLAIMLENCARVGTAENVKYAESQAKSIKTILARRDLDPYNRFMIAFNQGYLTACKSQQQSRLNPLRKRTLQQGIAQMQDALAKAPSDKNPVWQQRLGFAHFLFAHVLYHLNQNQQTAIEHYGKALAVLPNNGIPLLDLLAAWQLDTDSNDLNTIRYRYVKKQNDIAQLQVSSGAHPDWETLNADEYQKSVSELNEDLHPNYLRMVAYFHRGVLLQDSGNSSAAIDDLRHAWRINPFNDETSFVIAATLSAIGGDAIQAELDYHTRIQH